MKGREEEGRVTGVMIWATALLLPLALPPGGRERRRAHMGTLALAHKWEGQQSISAAAQSLPPSSLRRSASNFGRGPISSYPDGRRRRRETRREGKDLQGGNVRDGLAHGKRGDHQKICVRVG